MLLQIDQKFDWCVELLATVSLLLISSGHLQVQGMEAKEQLGWGRDGAAGCTSPPYVRACVWSAVETALSCAKALIIDYSVL